MTHEGPRLMRDDRDRKPSHEIKINPIVEAYVLIYNKDAKGMPEWQVAKSIIEALDDPDMIPEDLIKECIFEITNGSILWPDDATRIDVVTFAESQARIVFPELAHIDEVHMAEIEYAYTKWKQNKKEGK